MSEHDAGIDNPFALTPAEYAVTEFPCRYTTTLWQPLDKQQNAKKHWALRLLVWLLVLGLGGLGAVTVWQFMPLPMDGHVQTMVSGKLLVQDGADAPWLVADEGRYIRQGARLSAKPGTVACLLFDDGSQLRIESEGEWVCMQLAQSRNTRIKRVRIRQIGGQASYVSAPPQPGSDARVAVDLLEARFLLRGAASVVQAPNQGAKITVLQGAGNVMAFDQRVAAQSGEQLVLSLPQRQIIRTVGAASR